jgi:hypothetical protein
MMICYATCPLRQQISELQAGVWNTGHNMRFVLLNEFALKNVVF